MAPENTADATTAASRTPTQVLQEARNRDSRVKRARVKRVIEDMTQAGDRITFAAVARAAEVSTWLVYSPGVREHIDKAMQHQSDKPARDERAGLTASAASLRTDLELAREEIRQLRGERDKLRHNARLHLGQQLEQVNAAELIARVDELASSNQELANQLRQALTDNDALRTRTTALEDDLAAARTSLRRMIRNNNREPT
ncbi:hypothetical protein SAMN04488074_10991 [Lentzea albidocapillata subsp. violacea]|uniref:Replication region DNA-binding N-term n=1 Tax=Lentzea albidocapillata subsp. violacea TaxID=128104 RepID=A0A1G9HL70_9PSEU|nr:DUF6262 family protein [Lentzea albidocapillata]SDL13253.1 hypothetical protein SAMN04488074_10991 [Lentzea albidocapillata subsp. violacea]